MKIVSEHLPPRPGLFATVRNRHGVITAVEAHDAAKLGRFPLVEMGHEEQHDRVRILDEVW